MQESTLSSDSCPILLGQFEVAVIGGRSEAVTTPTRGELPWTFEFVEAFKEYIFLFFKLAQAKTSQSNVCMCTR